MPDLVSLSPIDHVLAARPVALQVIFEYPSQLDAQRLIDAFHATARRFVGVSGCLVRQDPHSLAFDVSRDLSEIRVTREGPDMPLHECIDAVDLRLGQPLARARIVDRGPRGTAVGFSMSHTVADGYGYFLFLAAWAARARGAAFPPPNCDRTLLSSPAARSPAERSPVEGPLEHSGFMLQQAEPTLRLALREYLLSEAGLRAERARDPAGYSASDLLMAKLWRHCFRDEDLPSTTLACPVDLRRYRAALGPMYFGNAFLHATVTASTAELRAASSPEIARRVHQAVAALPSRIEGAIDELEALWSTRGLAVLPHVFLYPPETGLLVSNLSRIDLSLLDFGAGPAVNFECITGADGAHARICFVLPAGEDLRLLWAGSAADSVAGARGRTPAPGRVEPAR